jgi:predicted RNA-binding Zn-ribbon protein involved in translation (DUF1610 family)
LRVERAMAQGFGLAEITLFVLFIATMVVGTAYLLMWLKGREDKKVRTLGKSKVEEDAYNQMQMVRSMARYMKGRGYDVRSVENMLDKAQRAYESGNYAESMDISNNAKRVLWRLKDERNDFKDELSPQVKKELEIIKGIGEKEEEAEMPPQVKDFIRKLPENYMQSKFEINVVEGKIMKMEDGQVKEFAKLYLHKAKKAFDMGEYTEALKYAIKGNRIIDTREIPQVEVKKAPQAQIVEEKELERKVVAPLVSEEDEEEEEEELRCPNCGAIVRSEDNYCWNCGAKLVFVYECPNCGAEVSSEDKFCRHCGYKLR